MLARALALAAFGFSVFPITEGQKIPPITGWPDLATTDPDEIRRLWTHDFWRACLRPRGEGTLQRAFIAAERAKAIEAARAAPLGEPAPFNIGIHTGRLLPNGGRLLVVDLDTKGKDDTARTPGYPSATVNERYASLVAAIGESLPKTLTSRTASRGLHLIFQYAGDIECPSPVGLLPGVDIRARGALIVAPGSWIEGKGRYAWELGRGPGEIEIAHAPESLLRFCNAGPVRAATERVSKPPACELDTPAAFARARLWLRDEAPEAVAGDGGRQTLKRVAQRLGDFGLSADGALDLLNEEGGWNETKAFPSFDAGVDDSDGMTRMIEDLFAYHREKPLGCDAPRDVRDTFEAVEGVDGPAQAPAPRSLGTFSAASLAGLPVPPQPWLVPDLIPDRQVTLLSGDGGVGKSLLAMQLGVAVARRGDWLGLPTEGGPVVYVSAEDDRGEIHRRLAKIVAALGVGLDALKDLHIVPLAGLDAIMGAPNSAGVIVPTPLWRAFELDVARLRPRLVILDTLADIFAGEENARADARQFVGIVRGLAIKEALAAVLLSHPSLTGMNTGSGTSGSTAWSNSVRSRLYLDRPKGGDAFSADPDVRILRTMKNQAGRIGGEIRLRWTSGTFKEEGAIAVGYDRREADAIADRVFLKLVAQYQTEGRDVTATTGANYAPNAFSKHASAEGLTKGVLSGAMNRLLESGRIKVETFGPPSRQRKRLVTGSEGAVE